MQARLEVAVAATDQPGLGVSQQSDVRGEGRRGAHRFVAPPALELLLLPSRAGAGFAPSRGSAGLTLLVRLPLLALFTRLPGPQIRLALGALVLGAAPLA
jgi:hypothetical protein